VLSGEGVQGLTAAFMGAGVPTIVASLWPVDDAATARLVERFYAELAKGRAAGEALRTAQRALREAGRPHPFYWAGFILVGDPEITVALRRRPPWGEVLALVLALAAGLLVLAARRPRRLGG
jgi:nucleotide-binding universal stress UspA family protein